MKKPRPYQKEIIEKAVDELSRKDRATVVMPCASGKTLVALWIIEQMNAKNIVVFVPTLGLLAQTAREFLANNRYQTVGCLAICSDTNVVKGLDEIRPAPEELPFTVTDRVSIVQEYLEQGDTNVKFLFCTYQSSDILGLALQRSGMTLDFAFFDEAHRTAGILGAPFTYILSNKMLPVSKRLFMTATLRVYSFVDARNTFAYSMDNSASYGQICARMSFIEAVKLGIICSYKVIVSVVDTNSLQLELLYGGKVIGEDITARDAAIRESILQALKKYDAKKVITYHKTIVQAENFAYCALKDGISGYEILHVNSDMTDKQRHEVMERFRNSERAIITNARCLTEGIDVPAVDMVVFAEPKHSEIDIVQAVGRAMRVREGKTTGYVLLPLFLDQKSGESINEALDRCNYETVWNVLGILDSIDGEFESLMALQRRELGAVGRLSAGPSFIDVIASFGIDARTIQESVGIFIVRRLSDLWEERYGELLRFKRENGHIAVPKRMALYHWLSDQKYRWNGLTSERQKLLLELGFNPTFISNEERWMKRYEELQAFKEQHGHINISSKSHFINWFKYQRNHWDTISPKRRELLLKLGFEYDHRVTHWQERLKELEAYAKKHKHCNVRKKENVTLYNFLVGIRQAYHKGKLEADQITALEGLGIIWGDGWERLFEDIYRQMAAYRVEHGSLPPSNTSLREVKLLVHRMLTLRKAYHNGKLSEEQIRRLKELEFSFEPYDDRWSKRYRELEEYVSKGGNPNRIPVKNHLKEWVRTAKNSYKKGYQSKEKIELLEKLGIVWDDVDYFNEKWQNYFQTVAEYFEKNGVNGLPEKHPAYYWLRKQLQNFHRLPPEKAEKIRSLKPERVKHRWSTWEKTLVRENPDKTAEELLEILIGRTPQAIQKLRDQYGW